MSYRCIVIQLNRLIALIFEDFQIRVSDRRFNILTNNEQKWNIYTSKSKFGCCLPETNQILKIEDVAIVSWLIKHSAFL